MSHVMMRANRWGRVLENGVNFAHSSRAFALLGEVLVKLGQNAPITRSSAEIANPPGFRPYLL